MHKQTERTLMSFDWAMKNIQHLREKPAVLNMSEVERRAYERYRIDRAVQDDVLQTAYWQGQVV